MKTKLLMTISAIILGIVGIILSFFPVEVSKYLEMAVTNSIILQILGALYFGFAMLNWTAKANLIGGIYSRPVAIGNFTAVIWQQLPGWTEVLAHLLKALTISGKCKKAFRY